MDLEARISRLRRLALLAGGALSTLGATPADRPRVFAYRLVAELEYLRFLWEESDDGRLAETLERELRADAHNRLRSLLSSWTATSDDELLAGGCLVLAARMWEVFVDSRAGDFLEPGVRIAQTLSGARNRIVPDLPASVLLHVTRAIDAAAFWALSCGDSAAQAQVLPAQVIWNAACREETRRRVLQALAYDYAGVGSRFDPAELAFSLPLLTRQRVEAALELEARGLRSVLEEQVRDGSWPGIAAGRRGDPVTVSSFAVAACLAGLLTQHVTRGEAFPLRAVLQALDRTVRLVESTYMEEAPLVGSRRGWPVERGEEGSRLDEATTCSVVLFLIRYHDALLALRQSSILAKYPVRNPDPPDFFWAELVPGLVFYPKTRKLKIVDPTRDEKVRKGLRKRIVEPISKSPIRRPSEDNAVVVYGPPGTKKTSSVRRVAKALSWPLIVLTPPVFLKEGGLEGFERSASAIFEDLLRLRRVVVLFDECEDFFKRRPPTGRVESRTLGAFITAGMLPRVRELRGNRWVVFVLATNSRLTDLDPAVVRRGRFSFSVRLGRPVLESQKRYVQAWVDEADARRDGSGILRALEQYDEIRKRAQPLADPIRPGKRPFPALTFRALDRMLDDVESGALPSDNVDAILEALKRLARELGPDSLTNEEDYDDL